MGPHALWLLEILVREYDLQVTAADLWVKPDENAVRITEADVADGTSGARRPAALSQDRGKHDGGGDGLCVGCSAVVAGRAVPRAPSGRYRSAAHFIGSAQ
jgi:hypothetical protein